MKKGIIISLLLFSKVLCACECPTFNPISKETCTHYDVIFSGRVDSVSICNSGISIAYFTINQLYKGAAEQHVKINFDCSSACLMSFQTRQEWLMYTTYKKFDLLVVDMCGHSRKFFNESSEDIYQLNSQRTFEEEKDFLKTTLGLQPFAKNNELVQQPGAMEPRNEQPSGSSKLILLFISFAVMAIVYFITRKKNKNGK
ncbi:MAG: hypothetical protein V4608_01120 [Bacteroidota bacterium]